MNKVGVMCIAALVTLIAGCTDPPYFHENRTFANATWLADEPEVFTFQINDTTQAYDFLLNLRHGDAYPFSNLYLFVQLDFPNGKRSVDTLECVLADSRGQWNGKKTGQLVDHRIMLNARRIFPMTGTYHFQVRHAMRVDPLTEIHDLGFTLDYWRREP